jgi:hypothetical protein
MDEKNFEKDCNEISFASWLEAKDKIISKIPLNEGNFENIQWLKTIPSENWIIDYEAENSPMDSVLSYFEEN